MSEQINVVLRSPTAEDKDYVMAHWLNNQRYGNPFYELQDAGVFYKEHAEKIKKVVLTPGVQVPIACDESNPSFILGFAVYLADHLFYIFVRSGFRRRGIAKLLLRDHEIKTVGGITKIGASLAKERGLIFQPL